MSKKKEVWLTALTDPLAQTSSYSNCICLSDFNNDGDTALIIGDDKNQMRVWRGSVVVSLVKLMDVPKAIFTFFADKTEPVTPWVGILCTTTIFFYRSVQRVLRPKAKFELPPFELDPEEKKIWDDIRGNASLEDCQQRFEDLRENDVLLTPHAHQFINAEYDDILENYKKEAKAKPIIWRFVR
jgi:hypothetical protein